MNKEERIEKYSKEAYKKMLQQKRERRIEHLEQEKQKLRRWRGDNPEKVKANGQESSRKGGKYYEQHQKYFSAGLPHERKIVRLRHGHLYRPYKQIIALESQIHHEWLPETAEYRGVALVEKDQHMHGLIDVIQILEGEITLFAEEGVRRKE